MIDQALAERLRILNEGGVIDEDARKGVERGIELLASKYGIALNGALGERFTTHVAMAIMRVRRGEAAAAPQGEVYDDFREMPEFRKAEDVGKELEDAFGVEFPASERQYVVMNLCTLFEESGTGKEH
jgi:transcriptional regulatory protein LevR